MKLLRALFSLGIWPIVHLTCAQVNDGGGAGASAIGAGKSSFTEEDIPDVGVVAVHAIASGDEQVAEELIERLETDGETTVVRVELGELWCGSLADVPDSTLLRFEISSNETVIAERTSYSSLNGSVVPDGHEHKVWLGNVVNPEPVYPRSVAISWTDSCALESFFLTIKAENTDGSITMIESFPCEAGSSVELCIVEYVEVFDGEEEMEATPVDDQGVVRKLKTKNSIQARGLRGPDGDVAIEPSRRKLHKDTEVTVMVLFTEEVWKEKYPLAIFMAIKIWGAYEDTNTAMKKSLINLNINLVHVGEAPDSLEISTDGDAMLDSLRLNEDVYKLRNKHHADLVQLVVPDLGKGTFGQAFQFINHDFAFSVLIPKGFDFHTNSHELGHNFGAGHNIEDALDPTGSAHGKRHCGFSGYRTIMAYPSWSCFGENANLFSNPDVEYNGLMAGDYEEHNNAQAIRDHMEEVSQYRIDVYGDHHDMCGKTPDCIDGLKCLYGFCVEPGEHFKPWGH